MFLLILVHHKIQPQCRFPALMPNYTRPYSRASLSLCQLVWPLVTVILTLVWLSTASPIAAGCAFDNPRPCNNSRSPNVHLHRTPSFQSSCKNNQQMATCSPRLQEKANPSLTHPRAAAAAAPAPTPTPPPPPTPPPATPPPRQRAPPQSRPPPPSPPRRTRSPKQSRP